MEMYSLSLSGEAGNQRLRPNKYSNQTNEPLVSPVTAEELADFLSIQYAESDDSLYESFLLAASAACVSYTNLELLEREYVYKSDYYPNRQDGLAGVSIMFSYRSWWINLPVFPVVSVDSVEVNGDLTDDAEIDLSSRPARVEPKEYGSIEITYTAGHESVEAIDSRILLGIKSLAAYLYEHRGACDVNDALRKSGAASMWDSCRMMVSL